MHIRFGRPISVEKYCDRAADRLVLRQITDEVMYEIRNLTGQEYVDEYATRGAPPSSNVVQLPERAAVEPEDTAEDRRDVLVVSAAALPGDGVASLEADGVERRSSAAAIKSRPLDLELSTA